MGVVITSRKTALTSELADLTMEVCTAGVAPSRMAKIFTTIKDLRLTRAQIRTLGAHRTQLVAGGQGKITALGAMAGPPAKPTRQSYGLCVPSGPLLARFYDDLQEVEADNQFRRRVQLVWGRHLAVDDSLKVHKVRGFPQCSCAAAAAAAAAAASAAVVAVVTVVAVVAVAVAVAA